MRKSQRGFSALEALLVLIIAGVVVAASWYVYKANKSANSAYDNAASVSSTVKPSQPKASAPAPTKTANQYAGWTTVTSKRGNFTFKYPASSWSFDWIANNDPNYTRHYTANMDGSENEIELTNKSKSTDVYWLYIYVDTQDQSNYGFNMYTDSQKLDNGIVVLSFKQPADKGQACAVSAIGASSSTGYKLNNGLYLSASGGYCLVQKSYTDLTYSQQLNSGQFKQALQILSSIKQQ